MATASAVRLGTSPSEASLTDEKAFARLYEDTVESVYRFAWMLCRDATRAEDITAEVYLRAWRNRTSYQGRGSAISWLLAIARNIARDQFRSPGGVTADLELAAEHTSGSGSPEDALVEAAEAARVHEAIAELTGEQQQVIFMRFYEGMAHGQIAARLGRNPTAVRALQFRALARLRKLLEGNDDVA